MHNMMEVRVRQFWVASLAWARHPEYVEGMTVERLFDILRPLEEGPGIALPAQAQALAHQVVMGRKRRRPSRRKGSNVVELALRTKKVGLEDKVAICPVSMVTDMEVKNVRTN